MPLRFNSRPSFRSGALVGVLALAGLTVLPSTGQTAAQSCPVIVDEEGDATAPPFVSNGANFLFNNVDAYDIVSADLAADSKLVNIVIRVKNLALSASSAPTGIFWRFDFTSGQDQLFAEVVSDSNDNIGQDKGVTAYLGYVDGTAHLIDYVKPIIDFKHNEVHVRVPLTAFKEKTPADGQKLTALSASGGRWYDLPLFTLGEPDDYATTEASYIVGRKTCIRA